MAHTGETETTIVTDIPTKTNPFHIPTKTPTTTPEILPDFLNPNVPIKMPERVKVAR